MASALYAPSGLALASSAWFGGGAVLLCAACEFAYGLAFHGTGSAFFGALALGVQAMIGWVVFRAFRRRVPDIENLSDAFTIVFCALMIATPLGGRFRELLQMPVAGASLEETVSRSLPWWMGDCLGVLVVTPLVLAWTQIRRNRQGWPQLAWVLESLGIFVSLAAVWVVFWSGWTELSRAHLPTNLGMLPFSIWAGLRTGRRIVAVVSFAIAAIVLHATMHGFGPYGEDPEYRIAQAQLYVAILSITAMVVAVVISERRRVAMELQDREAQLRVITDSVPVLIGQFDELGIIRFANQALQDWFGAETLLLGQKSHWLFSDSIVGAIEAALLGASPPFHAMLRHPRLGERQVEGRVAPHRGPDGEVVGGVILLNDVTEQRTMESQLRQAMKMEAVGQLAGGIAHDFNNLLSVVTGNLSLVEDGLPAGVRPMIEESLKACRRGASLVGQLLTFGRKLPISKGRKQPGKIIDEVLGIARATFDRRIDIVVDVAPQLPDVVVDAEQIEQVLLNLLINARDALLSLPMVDSPRVMRIRVSARAVNITPVQAQKHLDARPGNHIEFSVADTGVGLRPEIQAKVFEPFFTTKEVGKGTGLGLSSAYGAVRQNGGWITVSSQPGKGAVFSVFLPAVVAGPAAELATPPKVEVVGGHEKVMVVDDEDMIRRVAKRILENAGYSVIEASDGQEALEIFIDRQAAVDLVILDLSMPRMSGRETLTRLRLFSPRLPVIVSSGFDLGESPNHTALEKVTVVAKPYRNQDLLKAVRETLDDVKSSSREPAFA